MDAAAQNVDPLVAPVLESGMQRDFDVVHDQTDYVLREDRSWGHQYRNDCTKFRRYFIYGATWPMNEKDMTLNVSVLEESPVLFEVRERAPPCSEYDVGLFRNNVSSDTPWPAEEPLLYWKEDVPRCWASERNYLTTGNNEQLGYSIYPGQCSWGHQTKVFDPNGVLHYTLSKAWCRSDKVIVRREGVPVGFIRKVGAGLWDPGRWLFWIFHGEENITAAAFLQDESFVGRILLLRELVVHGRAFERAREEERRRRDAAKRDRDS